MVPLPLGIRCEAGTAHPEEWVMTLSILKFTHNNQRHADRQKTPFELMFGDTPIGIQLPFKNIKFPLIEDKMKTLIKNWEEALAAHEIARI